MLESMITTFDNPFDPFTEWRDWYNFDEAHGYHTTPYLARVTITSHELSETDERLAFEQAIDEVLKEDVLGIYKKVSREISEEK